MTKMRHETISFLLCRAKWGSDDVVATLKVLGQACSWCWQSPDISCQSWKMQGVGILASQTYQLSYWTTDHCRILTPFSCHLVHLLATLGKSWCVGDQNIGPIMRWCLETHHQRHQSPNPNVLVFKELRLAGEIYSEDNHIDNDSVPQTSMIVSVCSEQHDSAFLKAFQLSDKLHTFPFPCAYKMAGLVAPSTASKRCRECERRNIS